MARVEVTGMRKYGTQNMIDFKGLGFISGLFVNFFNLGKNLRLCGWIKPSFHCGWSFFH